jgi:hypothetical protein
VKRFALIPITAAVALPFLPATHAPHRKEVPSAVAAAVEVPDPPQRLMPRSSRSRRLVPIHRVVARPRRVKPRVVHQRPAVRRYATVYSCSNWRNTLNSSQVYIFEHESGMDPSPSDVNPSSGARGLGQLLPSTYADLSMTPDWDPCDEILAADKYAHERYGSWSAAESFWRAHAWW